MITICHSLLLFTEVLSIIFVFCRLAGRRSLGRVWLCREIVSHQQASRDGPFPGFRKSSGSHTLNAWLEESLMIYYWLGRGYEKEFLVHSVLSFRGCDLWLPGRGLLTIPDYVAFTSEMQCIFQGTLSKTERLWFMHLEGCPLYPAFLECSA